MSLHFLPIGDHEFAIKVSAPIAGASPALAASPAAPPCSAGEALPRPPRSAHRGDG